MTPAVGAAERAQIPFTLHEYEHDPAADSFGLEAARKLDLPPERVFKTLIARIDGKEPVMAILPVAARLDLKKLAAAMGGKKADMADPAMAERVTGYVVGGISPLGGRKRLRTILDSAVLSHPTVWISAGQRGLQMELRPDDLLRMTSGTTSAIATGT